jgi:hypothetical protein
MPARLLVPRRVNERSTAGGVRGGCGTLPARERSRRRRCDRWWNRAQPLRPVEHTTDHPAAMTRSSSLAGSHSVRLSSSRLHKVRDAPSAADPSARDLRARDLVQVIQNQGTGGSSRLRAPRVDCSLHGLGTGSTRTLPQATSIRPELNRPSGRGSHASSRLPAPIGREKVREACRQKTGSDGSLVTNRLRHALNLSKLTP